MKSGAFESVIKLSYFFMVVGMMYPDVVNKANTPKYGVAEDPQPTFVHVDVGKEFAIKPEFTLCEHMI